MLTVLMLTVLTLTHAHRAHAHCAHAHCAQEGLSTFQKRMQARTKNLQASLANEKSAVFRCCKPLTLLLSVLCCCSLMSHAHLLTLLCFGRNPFTYSSFLAH